MTRLEDCAFTAELSKNAIEVVCAVGKACKEAGVDRRTFRRCTTLSVEAVRAGGRQEALLPKPTHELSEDDSARILYVCHEPWFADAPPSQIVPVLAGEGTYIGSGFINYRVFSDVDVQHVGGRARRRTHQQPSTHCAMAANCRWCWDITFSPSPTRDLHYYLCMIIDVWSRKIVGYKVYESEIGELAAELFARTVLAERYLGEGHVIHADSGAPHRFSTLRLKLDQIVLRISYNRPRASNYNANAESFLCTTKYRLEGFAYVGDAKFWELKFVRWYNTEHRHSEINFVTPHQCHVGEVGRILKASKSAYEAAKAGNPSRWSGETRNWNKLGTVWLNPKRKGEDSGGKFNEAA